MVLDNKEVQLNKSVIDRNAHDIKNQLMIIMSMANNIESVSKNNDIKKYSYHIKESVYNCRYMLSLISNKAQEVPYNNKLINIHCVFASLLDSFYLEKNIIFKNKMNAKNPRIYANKTLIVNALYNIIINAVQEIEYAGKVTIKTYNKKKNPKSNYECSQWLFIEIEDSGKGINKDNNKKVFDQYFTTKKNKSGIGLFSAKNTIEKHNGTISVKCKQAKGAAFIIGLPVHVE